jgi:hypothetical protein
MMYQLSEDLSLNATKPAFEQAVAWTEFLKVNLRQFFGEHIAYTRQMKDRNRVLRLIREAHMTGISRTALIRNAHLLARDLDRVLETLRQEDRIEIIKEGRYVSYIAVEHLNGQGDMRSSQEFAEVFAK